MNSNKVLIVLGPRRIGKTTFVKEIIKKTKRSVLLINGEDAIATKSLKIRSVENYRLAVHLRLYWLLTRILPAVY
jgi:hypothetical protein